MNVLGRAAAVADDVDRDRRDVGVRERCRDGPRRAVHRVGEAVAEDRYRPAAGRRRAGRDEQGEDEVLDPLHGGNAGAGADRRERLRRVLVVGRRERAVGDRADRAGEVRRQEERAGVERRRGQRPSDAVLPVEPDLERRGVREDRTRTAGRDVEVRLRRRGAADLVADLLARSR